MSHLTLLGTVLLVIGALATFIEIHTLTFYLIPVALAGIVSGLATLLGFPGDMPFDRALTWSISIFAVIVLFGVPLAHWARKRLRNPEAEAVANDDVGNTVKVESVVQAVDGARPAVLRVQYRGSTWEAELVGGEPSPQPGQTLTIQQRKGNRLVVSHS